MLYYKFDDERKEQQPGALDKPATSPDRPAERELSRPPMVRCFAVFNVEQADGLKLKRLDDDTRLFLANLRTAGKPVC